MFFKNLQLYRLTKPFHISPRDLETHLSALAFKPCGRVDLSSTGWVSPLGRQGRVLVHAAQGRLLLCAQKEEKILPAAVIKEFVDHKAEEIEAQQGRKVRRKERDALRDEVMQDLLPRAFTRSSQTCAYISPEKGWMVIDAASAKKAEDFVDLLRRSIDGFQAHPPVLQGNPGAIMTRWLAGEEDLPAGFELGDECELVEAGEEGGIVRCKRHDLAASEIMSHLQAGKQVSRLALNWTDHLSCVLGDDLLVRRVRLDDVLRDELEKTDDAAAELDAMFVLMSLEFDAFLEQLLGIFSEQVPDTTRLVANA
ncbi:recombination-associated protein RdgC [Thermithiobacillus plumbiphilus]|uniref:Recombination-associated protein RdgC n=1 Tax=Thermithiobacillus plumbiphilus TaxID=1729899 RepID=A0ABU9D5L0_9PROT